MTCFSNTSAQSYFEDKEDVIQHLEGEWNLDAIAWMGALQALPTVNFYDSTFHYLVFETTGIDSLPLSCSSFINDTLFEQTLIEIEFEENDGFPGPWRLRNLPSNFSYYAAILEDSWINNLGQDTMTLFQMAFDGTEYAMSRRSSSSNKNPTEELNITLYPNPTSDQICIKSLDEYSHASYTIHNTLGQKLDAGFSIHREFCLDISSLSQGTYFLCLESAGRLQSTLKFIVIR